MSNDHQAAADYVAALSTELASIARQHGLDSTAYLLEIAAAEAVSSRPSVGHAGQSLSLM
jgi:hypothetical protein